MKYAYLLGSNVFVVPSNTLSFKNNDGVHQFLRILTVHHDTPTDQKREVLTIDANIKDNEGHSIRLMSNKPEISPGFDILEQTDRVLVTKADGHAVLDVHQLDQHTAMGLEHNISAELEVNMPFIAIRLRGDFIVGDLHITIDNEKLFLGRDSYANSAMAGNESLQFSHSGVII